MRLTRKDKSRIVAALECMRGSGVPEMDRETEALLHKLCKGWGFDPPPPLSDDGRR